MKTVNNILLKQTDCQYARYAVKTGGLYPICK